MIKRFIIKTNEWYESLPEIKGRLFYLSIIFIPYTLILFLTPFSGVTPSMLSLTWVFLVAMWRTSYFWIKDWENIKKGQKNDI